MVGYKTAKQFEEEYENKKNEESQTAGKENEGSQAKADKKNTPSKIPATEKGKYKKIIDKYKSEKKSQKQSENVQDKVKTETDQKKAKKYKTAQEFKQEYEERKSMKIPVLDNNYEYLTPKECAKELKTTTIKINALCRGGYFEGVFKIGQTWRIPRKKQDIQFTNSAQNSERQNLNQGNACSV